ncbi:hypothetical protein [Leisingera sp. JC11]|uniref:hypothetical protein n=1 Tax=Leisingera sp. JC11 TaxID=3042469 RepID=UPI003451E480
MAKKSTLEKHFEDAAKNTEGVRAFAERIRKKLSESATAWWDIAGILEKAERQYALSSDEMQALLSEVGFTKSKASKLIQVAKSERLREHFAEFSITTAWTVLYRITSLSDEEFALVLAAVRPGIVLTNAWIDDVIGLRKDRKNSAFKPLFSVEVDVRALKGLKFQGDSYEQVMTALETLKKKVPFLEVVDSGLFEKEYDRIGRDKQKARDYVLGKFARKAIADYKSASSEWKQYDNKKLRAELKLKPPKIGIYSDLEEALASAKASPPEFFKVLNADWFSESDWDTETTAVLHNRREKYLAENSADE